MTSHPLLEATLATITGVLFFGLIMVPGFWLRFGCMPWEAIQ
jgi:hypothetical protein